MVTDYLPPPLQPKLIITSSVSGSIMNVRQVLMRTRRLHVDDPKPPPEANSQLSVLHKYDLFTLMKTCICQHPRIKWSVWHDEHMGWALWLCCLRESVHGGRGRCPAVPSTRRHICTSRLRGSLLPSLHPSLLPSLPQGRLCLVKDSVYSCLKCFIQQPSGLDTLSMSFFSCLLLHPLRELFLIWKKNVGTLLVSRRVWVQD